MMKFTSNVIDSSFEGWFNRVWTDLSSAVDKKDYQECRDIVKDAFYSGYTMGVSEYMANVESWRAIEVGKYVADI